MAVSSVARLADDRALGKNDPGAVEAVEDELTQLRAQFSATPYPPTGAASGAVAVSKLVGRVEWVAGNTAMLGDQHWTAEPPAALAVTRQVAETLHQAAGLICDENARPVDDPAPIRELQESTRRLQRLIGDEVQDDISTMTQSVPAASPASRDRSRTADDDAVSAPDPGFHARALGIAAEMVADAALEAAGSEGLLDQRMDTLGQKSPRPPAPDLVPRVVPLGLVPQRGAGRHRSCHRCCGRRGHGRPARVLGRPGHVVGPAIECSWHRCHRLRAPSGAPRSGWSSAPPSWSASLTTRSCCGCCSRWRSSSPAWHLR